MITLNLSDPNSASQVLDWLKEQPRDCDECLRPATHPHPYPVKVAPAVFIMYVLCQSCKEHYEEHSDVYSKDDSARGIVRTYSMPRIATDSQRIAERMAVVL